ncbi:LytTR family DNA-binding domain-containing protein [Formosa maritima]|uniref:LytTR family transcriptional regulator n=1 Tax=Formosa maritima TaxID=2592046 RepID=A0A5D0GGC0_9FLAO|nr:LytTR family DNA-binding domain-containing protein [Formosa maritima]TYA56692.1 LytTR family transcriptional regulator [Formosa maritima]
MNKTTLLQVLSFLIFIFNFSGYAQSELLNDKEIIRLTNLLKKHAKNQDSVTYYANKLLKYSEENNLDYWRYSAYVALGNAQRTSNNTIESNNYYYKALHIAEQLSDSQSQYMVMNNIALNHKSLMQFDSAYYYFKKLDTYHSNQLEVLPASMAKMNIGLSFLQFQKLDSAAYYLNKSYTGFKEINNKRFIAQNLYLFAELQFQKKDNNKAISYADSSLNIAKENKLDMLLPSNYILLSRIYSSQGDEELANKYANLARESKPRVMDFSKSGISVLNENIKIKKAKEYESRLNEVEDSNLFLRSNLFIAILIILILSVIVYRFFKKHKDTENDVKEIQQKLEKIKESKLEDVTKEDKVIHLKSKASINSSNILYIKSDGHYVEYYLDAKRNPEIDRNTMIEVEKSLPSNSFIRIHKSYIVNINRIKIINSNKVMLDNGEWINLSRVYKQDLKDILNKE